MDFKLVDQLTANQLNPDIPVIRPGDTIAVTVRISEGAKSRLQVFQGLVMKTQGQGINYSVLVRKISKGVYVERTFPLHSPLVEQIKIINRGKVRQARIYYMRNRHGKAARIKESTKIR